MNHVSKQAESTPVRHFFHVKISIYSYRYGSSTAGAVLPIVALSLRGVLSFTEKTSTPAFPSRGQTFSQMPQPLHNSSTTYGAFTLRFTPSKPVMVWISDRIAFCGIGQCSSQTMQSIRLANGMQWFLSKTALPMTWRFFSSGGRSGIAPVGQT